MDFGSIDRNREIAVSDNIKTSGLPADGGEDEDDRTAQLCEVDEESRDGEDSMQMTD